MTSREAKICPTCAGLRRVYSCDWWPGCDCPAGTVLEGCNGQSHPCPDCRPAPRADRFALPRRPEVTVSLLDDKDGRFGPDPSPVTVLTGAALVLAIIAGIIVFIVWIAQP